MSDSDTEINDSPTPKKVGRPKKYQTDDERKKAIYASIMKYQKKTNYSYSRTYKQKMKQEYEKYKKFYEEYNCIKV